MTFRKLITIKGRKGALAHSFLTINAMYTSYYSISCLIRERVAKALEDLDGVEELELQKDPDGWYVADITCHERPILCNVNA